MATVETNEPLKKNKDRQHPLDRAGLLSYINFFWIKPTIDKADKEELTQASLSDVSARDRSAISFNKLLSSSKTKTGVFSIACKVYLCDFLGTMMLTILDVALSGCLTVLLYYLSLQIEEQIRLHGRVVEWQESGKLVGAMVGCTLVKSYLSEISMFERLRISIRIQGGFKLLIFEKLLKIGIINPNEHSEGSIINHLQVDLNKFENAIYGFASIFSNLLTFSVTVILGMWLFSKLFTWFVLFMMTSIIPCSIIFVYWLRLKEKWLQMKDRRITYWKNLYGVARFFKTRGTEHWALEKLNTKRKDELQYQFLNSLSFSLFVFFVLMWPPVSIIAFLKLFFKAGYELEVSKIAIFIKMIVELTGLVFTIPIDIQFLNDLTIGIRRVNKFMSSRELQKNKRDENQCDIETDAVTLSGEYYWDKKLSIPTNKQQTKKIPNTSRKTSRKAPRKSKGLASEATIDLKQPFIKDQTANSTEPTPADSGLFSLKVDRFVAPKSEVTFLLGKIGAGKSTLLYSLLQETRIKNSASAHLNINGSVGFVAQRPWLINGTIKQNIILEKPLDEEQLSFAIRNACLDEDLNMFPKGIDQETGENGDALSGGQRARLSLAQCLYADPEIYIFDDVFSALDLHVGSFLMEETIRKRLFGKTLIISTNSVQYIKPQDKVYFIENGAVRMAQDYKEVTESELYLKFKEVEGRVLEEAAEQALEEEEELKSSLLQNMVDQNKDELEEIKPQTLDPRGSRLSEKLGPEKAVLNLLKPEDKATGTVSFRTYITFFKELGGLWATAIPFAIAFSEQALQQTSYLFLSDWAANFKTRDPDQMYKQFFAITFGYALCGPSKIVILAFAGYILSRKIHAKMACSLLHSKIEEFLSRVPSGRVMNRFSHDLEKIDQETIVQVDFFFYKISDTFITLFYFSLLLGWETMTCVLVLVVACVIYQRKYMSAKREILRLLGISKSPILNTFGDTIRGLPTIRALKNHRFFFKKLQESLDVNSNNVLLDAALVRWYNIRTGLFSIVLLIIPSYLLLLFYLKNLETSQVVISILLGTMLSQKVKDLLIRYSFIESSMIAVERCHHFEKIEPEPQYKSYKKDFALVDGSKSSIEKLKKRQIENTERIVTEGSIEFKDMSCKYATSQNPILSKLSFAIKPREKIGVIGRTGSGKSTLIKLLWRALDFYEGDIKIDGKSIKEVDLKSLRSQIMIVTQETALIEGTLRENIDIRLEDKSKDAEITEILTRLGFANPNYLKDGLDMAIDGEGSNLSAGEKQLISFARTLLDKKKIMILDEATANIDLKTEEKIQACVDQDFKDTTMLIIAHRIQTIMNCDRILILEKGKMAALDTPANLSNQKDSYFNNIINKMKEKKS